MFNFISTLKRVFQLLMICFYLCYLNYLLYPYLKPVDLCQLLRTGKSLCQEYRQNYIWRHLTNRIISHLGLIKPHINNYYLWYSILVNPKHRCHICYQAFNQPGNQEGAVLLLCDCLGLKHYLYAHKSCQYYTVKRGFSLYQYKCRYCQKTKLCLPIKTLI